MKNVGQFLKNEREKLNFSLEEVAERTKIHLSKLAAIEAGDREALPAKVFCVGLIKSYARELKVDMQKVDQLCAEAFAEPVKEEELIPPPKKVEKEETETSKTVGLFQFPKIVAWLASLVVIVALLGIIYAVVNKLNSYSEEEALPVEVFQTTEVEETTEESPAETEADKKQQEKVAESTPEPSKTESEEKPVAKPEPPPQVKPEPKKAMAPPPEPKPEPTPEPVAQVEKEKPEPPQQEPEFTDDNNFETESTESSSATVVSDNKLVITALEPIRAEVVWSDGYVQVMLLKSQETKTLVFSSPIKLRLNNGGAVQVSFNDAGSKVPGTFNQPIELSFP